MPIGLVVFSWNKRIGAEVSIRYPEDFQVSNETLMRIFSTHAFEESGGFLSIMIGELNIASYYSGPEIGTYISLFLSLEDDPDSYEDAILDATSIILSHRNLEQLRPIIPKIYAQMVISPNFTDEQKIAAILSDRAKRIILDNLEKDGSSTKGELINLLKDTMQLEHFDINTALNSLIKLGLTILSSVKELPTEGIFLIGNTFVTRIPPAMTLRRLKQLELSSETENHYLSKMKAYFEQYKPNPTDNEHILEIIIDPDTYTILNLLRLAPVTKQSLNKVENQVRDMNLALKKLLDTDLLLIIKNKKDEEYYLLISDIRVQKYFPEYILNTIRLNYNQKTKPSQTLIEHLKLLRESYTNLQKEIKSSTHLKSFLNRIRKPYIIKKIDETIKIVKQGKKEASIPVTKLKEDLYNRILEDTYNLIGIPPPNHSKN